MLDYKGGFEKVKQSYKNKKLPNQVLPAIELTDDFMKGAIKFDELQGKQYSVFFTKV